jgi:general secretion pathway protein F
MIGVIPKITEIFSDQKATLPWNTQLLIGTSHFIGSYWWLIAIVVTLSIMGFRRWRRSPEGRRKWDGFILRLPLVGRIARLVAISRFARTLGTMLGAGVPLLKALEISRFVLSNVVLEKVIDEARDAIREGDSIAAPFKRSGHFPPVVTHMIAVGERSGQLEQMLDTVGRSYEGEVDVSLSRFTSVLEPLMIVAMGGTVAFIVFSMLMPIMQMNEFVK